VGGAVGSVVTLAATVVGVYITVIDRPTWTADDWRQQANAVCERDTAKLHDRVVGCDEVAAVRAEQR